MRGKRIPKSHDARAARGAPFGALVALSALAALLSLSAAASAVSLQPNTPTSDADIVYRGGPADELPSAVAAGRFNGDPYDDALMCSWANNSCWLFYGGASSNRVFRQGDVVFVGPSGGFGGSATFLGDVNGDGYQDIAIGAPWTAGAGTAVQGGSLWVFFGRAGTVSGSVGYYDANLMVFSTQSFARLGASASAAGDMNGDGIDDFWVSAPLYNGSAGAQGSLFLFLGKRSFPPSINETSAALVIEGIEPPAAGGHVLLGKRDLNRDGRPDLVVSSASYADATGAAAGAAHVFLGPLPRARAVLSTADADVSIWGTSSVPSLGSSLAFAENFTRGGAPTLVVGADYREESPGVGGAVYLFNSSQFVCCLLLHTWDADGLIYSTEAGDGAGRALATGDFDGDGWVDLAIGAPGAANARGELVGRAYLLYGNTTGRGPVQVSNATGWVNGPHNGSQFGRLLVALHLNDDGKADFLAGAPMAREPSGTNGAAYSFFGRLRNRAPVASIDVVANATEGDVLLAAVNLSDMDDDRLSWVWSLGAGGSPGDHTNASFVELRFPNEGTYTILLEVFDGELYVVAQATIVVANAPPECEIRAVTAFVEGAEGTLAVNLSDPGGDQLSFSWFGPPGLEPSNRSAYYTPPRGQGFEVRVGVVDDAGASSVCTLAVPVENVPPTVSITAPGVVYEGDWVQLGAVAQDPGGYDEFTLTWSTPEGTAAGGALEWFARTPGFWGFDVEATDMDGGSGTAQVVLRVIGRAPQVDLLVPTGVFEGDAVNLTVEQVRGWEYDTLTFTWSVCRYGTQLNAQPTFAIARAAPGRFCVYVHVSDEDGDVVELEGSLNVANRAPLDGLRVSPEPPFAEDQELTFTPVLSRFETSAPEEIKYNWTVNGVLIDWGRVFRAYLPSGDHKVTVEATDPDGGVSRLSLRIIIENVPPLVAIVGPTEVQPGALSRWLASASDPSGGAVEVEWEVDGVRSTMGKELEWSSRTAGPHVIRVYATDTGGAVASASITVEVLGPPTVGAGIDLSWIGLVVGASAAFAAGIVLGAYVLDRLRNRRKVDELWKR